MATKARTIEDTLLNILAVLVMLAFFVLWGGVIRGVSNITVISMGLLIISATQITTFLFLLKIYERVSKTRLRLF